MNGCFFSHLVGSAINLTRQLGSGRQTVQILCRGLPPTVSVSLRLGPLLTQSCLLCQSIDQPRLSAGELLRSAVRLPLTARRSAAAEIILSVCLGFVGRQGAL